MIFVIDDNSDTCRIIVRLLDASGYRSMCFYGGGDALPALLSHSPSLLILDMMMPQMSGTDLLLAVRSQHRLDGVPVIVLSGTDDQDAIAEITDLGIQKYISKSRLSWATLTSAVAEIVPPPG